MSALLRGSADIAKIDDGFRWIILFVRWPHENVSLVLCQVVSFANICCSYHTSSYVANTGCWDLELVFRFQFDVEVRKKLTMDMSLRVWTR
jgi:hypothetical protein